MVKKFSYFILIFSLFIPVLGAGAQSVDLLWQADTLTPPFYKGGSRWSYQSPITLVAIPHGLGNTNNLNYRWTNNGTVIGAVSGVGKSSYSFIDSIVSRPQNIQVEVISNDESVLAKNSIVISSSAPEVLVYENNPLYGLMLHKALSTSYELISGEVTLEAVPTFFGEDDYRDGIINYKWNSGGGETYTGKSATYRAPENSSGSSVISINISNGYRILQTANKNLLINFGEK